MRNLNHETITEAVLARHADTADPRFKQIMSSLIRHLPLIAEWKQQPDGTYLVEYDFVLNPADRG